ncbi:MAG TPA: response regulator [Methylomirabilota bacterium]|jgi:CheY-like chemotaxis protein|nr:response regulator [Methylomirabilota bacterium]
MARILLVDDDYGWLGLYRLELGGAHEILEASDVPEALEVIQARVPDLIILDYHLPGLSGPALLQRLRVRGLQIPVILCTADPARAAREECDAVVSKHTDLRRLRRTIDAVLAARHASDPGRAA